MMLKTSQTQSLQPGMAKLKETTFPPKRCRVMRLTREDDKILSLKISNAKHKCSATPPCRTHNPGERDIVQKPVFQMLK